MFFILGTVSVMLAVVVEKSLRILFQKPVLKKLKERSQEASGYELNEKGELDFKTHINNELKDISRSINKMQQDIHVLKRTSESNGWEIINFF